MELDVQRTRDGEIAVLHDGDLMRMAGDPRNLGALTVAELAILDIGIRRGAAFTGEHPPTLKQVIDLVRGRMKINVELKYNVPDPALAPAVVELLRREDFVDQVVITSLDYAALKQIKVLEPRLKTGHIVTAAVGNMALTEADFLSLNAARATPEVIRRAHAAGKGVHVWTVNMPEVMLRMIERGVDNIITDDPALLAAVIRQRQSLSRSEPRRAARPRPDAPVSLHAATQVNRHLMGPVDLHGRLAQGMQFEIPVRLRDFLPTPPRRRQLGRRYRAAARQLRCPQERAERLRKRPGSGDPDHDLADLFAGFHIAHRFERLLERIHAVDDRGDAVQCRSVQRVFEHAPTADDHALNP